MLIKNLKKFFVGSRFLSLLVVIFVFCILFTYSTRSYFFHQAVRSKSCDTNVNEVTNNEIKKSYKMAILMPSSSNQSLRALAKRLKIAADSIGWNTKIFTSYNDELEDIKKLQPHFIFSLLWGHNFLDAQIPYNVYLFLPMPFDTYHGDILSFKPTFQEKKFPHIHKADGYLYSFEPVNFLVDHLKDYNKKFFGFKSFQFVQKTKYEQLDFKEIVHFSSNWDKLRSSNRFKIFFQDLAKTGYLNVFGPKHAWTHVSNAWRGNPDDSGWEVINNIKKYGISLIVHSRRHFEEGIPSAGLFEAAASSAIIISDRNKFVVENFGDSVLYFDNEKNSHQMHEEVVKHVKWIKANPDKARAMSKKAHQIFVEKFTLEQELIKLAKMHEIINKANAKK